MHATVVAGASYASVQRSALGHGAGEVAAAPHRTGSVQGNPLANLWNGSHHQELCSSNREDTRVKREWNQKQEYGCSERLCLKERYCATLEHAT